MKAVFTAIVCVLSTAAWAAVGPVPDIATRARGAASIVTATVVDVNPRFATNRFGDRLIVSDLVLDVSKTLKGPRAQGVTVTVEGGRIGDLTLRVSDLPSLKRGERAVFFLDRNVDGLVPHGRGLGILKVDTAEHVEQSALTLPQLEQLIQDALK